MAKTEIKDSILKETTKKKRGKLNSQEDLSDSARITLYMEKEQFQKLKALAYWKRVAMKDIVSSVLDKFLASQKIDPIPSNTKLLEELIEDAALFKD